MTELQAKQLAFLNDTISFYNSNNRGYNPQCGCIYSSGCAIGRHLPPEVSRIYDERVGGIGAVFVDCNADLLAMLPEWLKELGPNFLSEVQELHDSSYHWNENGLTKDGIDFVNDIKKDYHLN